MVGAKQRDVKSLAISQMRSYARVRPRILATWSSFLPALPRSTCSRATLTGATNSGVSSMPCPNESDKVSEDLYAQKEIAGGDDAARDRFRCRLRRSFGTEHEAFASALDCAFAGRRRGDGTNCLQRA